MRVLIVKPGLDGFSPGSEAEVSEDRGLSWVAAGFAVVIAPEAPRKPLGPAAKTTKRGPKEVT